RRDDHAIAGVINVSQIFHGNFRSAYLGYYAGARFMGQGYMSEGLRLVLRHAFGTLRLHRLEANIQPQNRASIRLVRRAGFRREGFSPRYLKVFGQWRDHERWAITAEAFRRGSAANRCCAASGATTPRGPIRGSSRATLRTPATSSPARRSPSSTPAAASSAAASTIPSLPSAAASSPGPTSRSTPPSS